jgi:hypothetical protein
MVRKLSMVLPALFVLVFAFCLVVSMHSPVGAAPSQCCRVCNVCDGVRFCGECPRINNICVCTLTVSYCVGPPKDCVID